jgi:hypothetical protein
MKNEKDTAKPYEAVLVTVTNHKQMDHGYETGLIEWYAETSWPQGGEMAQKTQSVLGRSTLSPYDAACDWTRRANLDGHRAKAIYASQGHARRKGEAVTP